MTQGALFMCHNLGIREWWGQGMGCVSISFPAYCVSQGNLNTHDFDLELGNVSLRCADSDTLTPGLRTLCEICLQMGISTFPVKM